MNSPLRKQRGEQGMSLGNPSVTLSTCDPSQATFLHHQQTKGESLGWPETTMFHKQNLSDELLPRMTGGSPATAPRMSHLGVGHVNTSSKSMDGLNSNMGALSAEHPAFARTRQYRSMSNDDMKSEMLPPKRLPGEPTNYMEAAAAAMQSGKGSSIIDNLMKEYRSGNLYARQPADFLLPSAKEDPTQMKTDLALHRENSAPQLSALRERQMKSPPDYPGHSRFAPQNFDITPSSTPRASSPLSVMSDMDFPTSRSNRSAFGSRDTSSAFGDFDTGLNTRSRGRMHSPFSTLMSDFDKGAPPPEYPGFKRTPWQSHSGREFRSRKESATVDHSRASSFGSYQHSLQRLSSETSYDSSRGSTSSTSPLSTDAPAPHPSPASQASQVNFELDHEAIASRATHMVEILSDENNVLRHELETYYQKVAKLQKFEQEIHNVQTEHERLIESTHKREHLEKLVRAKLEVEVKKLQERNRDLTVHVESHVRRAKAHKDDGSNEADLQEELMRKENTIFQTQMRCKDLEETNMQLMNELKEQRLHVDMLDAALSKAQADVTKLQEECAQRQVYVDKVRSLQQLVTSLQAAHQKREKLEHKLREKMEKEIEKLRGRQSVANQDEGVSELEDATSESLAEKECAILKLEAEVSKWEHKYLEECAIRQCHVEVPPNSRLSGVHDMESSKERDEEGSSRHKARIYDLERRLSALSTEVQKRDIVVQALQNQIFASMSSSTSSSYPDHIHPPSPQQSYESLRRGSVDSSPFQSNLSGSPAVSSSSLQNLASRSPASSVQNLHMQQQQSPASSTHSLQHYLTKSPATSTQNLHMSPASSNQNLVSKSPVSSQQNLHHMASMGGRSPAGSQQSLGALARPPSHTGSAGSGLGSQERLMGFSDSYASLSTSGLSMTGTDGGSEADLAREKSFLDEKLKQLDLEIAQQDKILGSIWKT